MGYFCPKCTKFCGEVIENVIRCPECRAERPLADAMGKRRSLPPDLKKRLHRRQDGRCGICGFPLDLEDANLDHLIPRHHGGETLAFNIRLTHVRCNYERNLEPLPPEHEAIILEAMRSGSRAACWLDLLPMPEWPTRN